MYVSLIYLCNLVCNKRKRALFALNVDVCNCLRDLWVGINWYFLVFSWNFTSILFVATMNKEKKKRRREKNTFMNFTLVRTIGQIKMTYTPINLLMRFNYWTERWLGYDKCYSQMNLIQWQTKKTHTRIWIEIANGTLSWCQRAQRHVCLFFCFAFLNVQTWILQPIWWKISWKCFRLLKWLPFFLALSPSRMDYNRSNEHFF